MSKIDELRAENERLKTELAIARENRATVDSLAKIAEAVRVPGAAEAGKMIADKERELSDRLQREHEEARANLAEGPKKFWVHLAHQLPVGTTLDHPELLVGAASEGEARKKYLAALGVIRTRHEVAVMEAVEGVPCDSVALVRMAEAGYIPD